MARCKINFPYVAVVGKEYLIVVERKTLCSCSSLVEALAATIGAYYSFNIEYPSSLKIFFIFLEKILVGVQNNEKVPASVNRLYTSLEALTT